MNDDEVMRTLRKTLETYRNATPEQRRRMMKVCLSVIEQTDDEVVKDWLEELKTALEKIGEKHEK